jgi:hypothetical protein
MIDGRLQKLKTLAERGSHGERENAAALLLKLCKKYDMTLDQIESSDERTIRYFKYKNGKVFERRYVTIPCYKETDANRSDWGW